MGTQIEVPDPALDLDVLAASLRADAGDTDTFFTVLADKLTEALPQQASVERGGFLGRGEVKKLELTLGDRVFEAERDGASVRCRCRSVVRGISLKSEELDLDAWLGRLAECLSAEAARSDRARRALEDLLT